MTRAALCKRDYQAKKWLSQPQSSIFSCKYCFELYLFACFFFLQDNQETVHSLLPDGDFKPMIECLEKILSFMKITVSLCLMFTMKFLYDI